jgi:AraC-like DNA-binding protein
MPPQSQHLSLQPHVAADAQPQGARATILVSHGSALVSAGLLATLGRLPQCVLRVWDRKQGLWHDARSLEGIDLVVADAESFVPATRSGIDEAPRLRTAAPRVVLITSRRTRDRIRPPAGADACLPLGCGEEELFGTVHSLTSAARQRPATPARAGLTPGTLRRVREHIEDRLSEKIELRELADIAKLSACHFSRAFKQSVGVPPHRYVMTRRIATAAHLVRESDSTLTEIALIAGFSDQSHFTRVFVEMMGEGPRAYRRLHSGPTAPAAGGPAPCHPPHIPRS